MLPQTLFLTATAFSAAVLGAPSKIQKRDWINDNGGNLKMTFSDEKINLGSIKVQDIIDKLAAACNSNGLCDTSPITIDGEVILSATAKGTTGETLTLNPGGSYDSWIHNGLVDALHAAVDTVAECYDHTWTMPCMDPMHGACNYDPITLNECTVPQFWGIRYEADDDTSGAFMELDMSVSVEQGLGDFCSTIASVGSAVAGAVEEALPGTAFALMGIFCGAAGI